MNKEKLRIVDGCVVEVGPIAVQVEPKDLKEWNDLQDELTRTNFRLETFPATIFGGVGIALILIPLVEAVISAYWDIPVANMPGLDLVAPVFDSFVAIVILGCVAANGLAHVFLIRPEKRLAKKQFEQERQTILTRYGDYKVDETTTVDNWYYGWRGAKYVIVAKDT